MRNIFDTHNHLWLLKGEHFSWITDEMAEIKKDFLLSDLQSVMDNNIVVGSILVQAQPDLQETEWLIEIARTEPRIKGVIGWVDVSKGNGIEKDLDQLMLAPGILKGIRYMSQGLPPEHLYSDKFVEGVQCIGRKGLIYELLITHTQIEAAEKLIRQCPETTFVINHIAKPDIASGNIKAWSDGISVIAERHSNVYCKLSGMVTEANWKSWKKEDIYPYISVAAEKFGPDKIMFGSDWPVSLLAAQYSQVVELLESWLAENPEFPPENIFIKNAQTLYGSE